METLLFLPPALGIFGLVIAFVLYNVVKSYDPGSDILRKIADQIHLGAMVFMNREYKMLAMFSAVLIVLLAVFLNINTALAFTVGAVSSALAGYIGMFTATKANVRTTVAANQ